LHGDGTLSTTAPAQEPADRFVYDPLQPVPSIGGANLTPFANTIGPRDQQSVELRADVLVYSTEVLERPLEVTGPITAVLYVSSSAPDTDITCKLVDVHPNGRAMLLTDGILRLRYRRSFEKPTLLQPDEIVAIRVDLWGTANVFLAGHRLRLEVTSSCFPKFARNSNTGHEVAAERRNQYQLAINRIHHDADHPSHLLLSMIERA
jgi:putative CocE/NonD family hydrolase